MEYASILKSAIEINLEYKIRIKIFSALKKFDDLTDTFDKLLRVFGVFIFGIYYSQDMFTALTLYSQ